MKKIIIKKKADGKYISVLTRKPVSESQFWQKIALEQQIILHAKNRT